MKKKFFSLGMILSVIGAVTFWGIGIPDIGLIIWGVGALLIIISFILEWRETHMY